MGAALSAPGHPALRTALSRGCPEGFPFGKGISLGQSQDAGEVLDVACGVSACSASLEGGWCPHCPPGCSGATGVNFVAFVEAGEPVKGPRGVRCLHRALRGDRRSPVAPPRPLLGSPAHQHHPTAQRFPAQPCLRAPRRRGRLGEGLSTCPAPSSPPPGAQAWPVRLDGSLLRIRSFLTRVICSHGQKGTRITF